MALREGTRRWTMRAAWAALLIASSVLVGLRVGRPVYYTDGERALDGRALAGSGMLQWRMPEVVVEVPGPVAGRVAALRDGRLLYGRLGADGTSDLVTWDPARASVPPEPVYALNTPQNELAPAVGADGRIWFASDRDGGAGGYDLYVAPGLAAAAGEVAPVPACRTALDETDPAPHPNGIDLVFVRSDRRVDGGNDGALWRWRFGDPLDPVPVFAPPGKRGARTVARDPVFAADGAALWFVQRQPGERLALARASLQNGVYDEPLRVGATWATGELRSPAPAADGRSLALLLAKTPQHDADLWYVAHAQEVYPWWPGQRWLELLLVGVIAASGLLLVLLHLGRRWKALDFVAQCLLLSLLVHVLLFLWLMGVEVVGSLGSRGDAEGGFEVSVIGAAASASAGATASGGAGGGSEVDDAVRFTPNERSLAAAVPGTSPSRADGSAALAPAAGEWERTSEAHTVATAVPLADTAGDAARRDGADAATPVAPKALGAVDTAAAARAADARAARGAAAQEAVEVVVPGSGIARAAPAGGSLLAAASASPAAALAAPGPAADRAVPGPTLHEAPAPIARSSPSPSAGAGAGVGAAAVAGESRAAGSGSGSSADAGAPAALAPVALSTKAPASASPGVGAQRAHADGGAAASPAAEAPRPGSSLARPKAASLAATAGAANGAAALAAPVAHGGAVPLTAARDAPAPGPARGDAKPFAGAAAAADAPAKSPSGAPGAAGGGNAAGSPSSQGSASRGAPLAAVGAAANAPVASTAAVPHRAVDAGTGSERGLAAAPPRTQLARGTGASPAAPVAAAPSLAPAGAYSTRFGPAKAKALEEFGGTVDTERAVANGLRYLAKQQNLDGSWGDRSGFDGKYGLVYVGKTGLCVLAFLGAGHTPQSNTEHSAVVQRAIAHLLSLQDENGAFGASSCYGHGIATYALAECYGITKNRNLVRPLERALTWILDNQGPRRDRRNRGGWGYFSPGLKAEDDYARVSVSSWMIMALESARLSGVELPAEVLPAAREFLELAYDQPNGWFRYNHKPSRVNSAWPTLPASTPAAAFCLMLLGAGKDDAMVRGAVDWTAERRPEAYRRYSNDDFVLRGQGNVYFWYYGTLACFLAGGDAWAQWNERLRTVLPQAQTTDGSWTPIDVYAEQAGDNKRDHCYTTAMCVLCLEVYYRYFTPLLLGR